MARSVSVIVTSYNKAPYLASALDSVLDQTYEPLEILVVDDGSTDETRQVIAEFGSRVIAIFQANRGASAARNTGIHRAQGELLAFLDGDDLWEREKLRRQVEVAELNPYVGLIAVDGVQFDQAGVIRPSLFLGEVGERVRSTSAVIVTGRFHRELVGSSTFIATTSQVMIPRHVFDEVGMFQPRLRRANDYELYLRISARFELALVNEPLVRWRYVETSLSGPRPLRFRSGEAEASVLASHARGLSAKEGGVVRRESRRRLLRTAQRGYLYGREQDPRWARRYLLGLFLRHPTSLSIAVLLGGLCCPDAAVRILGPAARRVFFERRSSGAPPAPRGP